MVLPQIPTESLPFTLRAVRWKDKVSFGLGLSVYPCFWLSVFIKFQHCISCLQAGFTILTGAKLNLVPAESYSLTGTMKFPWATHGLCLEKGFNNLVKLT